VRHGGGRPRERRAAFERRQRGRPRRRLCALGGSRRIDVARSHRGACVQRNEQVILDRLRHEPAAVALQVRVDGGREELELRERQRLGAGARRGVYGVDGVRRGRRARRGSFQNLQRGHELARVLADCGYLRACAHAVDYVNVTLCLLLCTGGCARPRDKHSVPPRDTAMRRKCLMQEPSRTLAPTRFCTWPEAACRSGLRSIARSPAPTPPVLSTRHSAWRTCSRAATPRTKSAAIAHTASDAATIGAVHLKPLLLAVEGEENAQMSSTSMERMHVSAKVVETARRGENAAKRCGVAVTERCENAGLVGGTLRHGRENGETPCAGEGGVGWLVRRKGAVATRGMGTGAPGAIAAAHHP
jgi:hypothetical protein